MTLDEVRTLLATISDLFPNTRFGSDADETWFKVLRPYPAAQVAAVVDVLCQRQRTFPPNAYQIAGELEDAVSGERSAEDLWGAITRMAGKIHPDHRTRALREIAALDPLAADAVDELRWFYIASAETERTRSDLFARFKVLLTDARARERRALALAGVSPDGVANGPDRVQLPG